MRLSAQGADQHDRAGEARGLALGQVTRGASCRSGEWGRKRSWPRRSSQLRPSNRPMLRVMVLPNAQLGLPGRPLWLSSALSVAALPSMLQWEAAAAVEPETIED